LFICCEMTGHRFFLVRMDDPLDGIAAVSWNLKEFSKFKNFQIKQNLKKFSSQKTKNFKNFQIVNSY